MNWAGLSIALMMWRLTWLKRKTRGLSQEEAEIGHWRQSKTYDRYTDHLFQEILVPVGHNEGGFLALEQALIIAQKEPAALRGLHILPARLKLDGTVAKTVQSRI